MRIDIVSGDDEFFFALETCADFTYVPAPLECEEQMSYTEEQVRNEAMKELLHAPGCRLSTSQLIDRLSAKLPIKGKDAQIADGRSDTYFSQKVRNLVSHRDTSRGLQARGLADYDKKSETLTLTKQGRSHAATL